MWSDPIADMLTRIRNAARVRAREVKMPASNLKLGSGIAPVASILEAGVNVGLGSDGAPSNNRLDLFAETGLLDSPRPGE